MASDAERAPGLTGPTRPDGTVGESAGSRTVDRALRLLDILARPEHADGVSMTALAYGLGVSRPAAYRLVDTLERHGYASRRPGGRVRLGLAVTRLSAAVAPMLRAAATPVLRRLADQAGATAHLTVADGGEAQAVVVVEPSWTAMHVGYRAGQRHPLDSGAAGRAILAGRSGRLDPVTSQGELQAGAFGIAAAVPGDVVEASVGVVSLTELDADTVGPLVVQAAADVAAALR